MISDEYEIKLHYVMNRDHNKGEISFWIRNDLFQKTYTTNLSYTP